MSRNLETKERVNLGVDHVVQVKKILLLFLSLQFTQQSLSLNAISYNINRPLLLFSILYHLLLQHFVDHSKFRFSLNLLLFHFTIAWWFEFPSLFTLVFSLSFALVSEPLIHAFSFFSLLFLLRVDLVLESIMENGDHFQEISNPKYDCLLFGKPSLYSLLHYMIHCCVLPGYV